MSLTPIATMYETYYDTYANLPVTGLETGALGYATDRKVLYRWSGAAWQANTAPALSGLYAAIPAAGDYPDGTSFFATDTEILYQVSGGAWVQVTADTANPYNAGDNLIQSNDDESTLPLNNANVWHLSKEILLPISGTLRIKFDMKSYNAGIINHARIYRNNVATGTDRTNDTTTYTTYSEDIAGWDKKDLLQLWTMYETGASRCYCKNLRLYVGDQSGYSFSNTRLIGVA